MVAVTPDLLQQLRDIHPPTDPGWWPPAPGWWLLALLAVATIAALVWMAFRRWRELRPWRAARRLHANHKAAFGRGEIGALDYLNACNDVLRRLLVYGYGVDGGRHASGRYWLAVLDATFGGNRFARGAGRILAHERFAPEIDPQTNLDDFDKVIERALGQRPPRRSGVLWPGRATGDPA